MAKARKRIEVAQGTVVARLLDKAARTPLLLETDGELYRLQRADDDIWADYDPEKVREALTKYADRWQDTDIEAFIYRGREEGTKPLSTP